MKNFLLMAFLLFVGVQINAQEKNVMEEAFFKNFPVEKSSDSESSNSIQNVPLDLSSVVGELSYSHSDPLDIPGRRPIPIGNLSENVSIEKVYPNPTNGLLNIEVSEESLVKIVDACGKMVGSFTVNSSYSSDFEQPAGMYFIIIENENGITVTKLIMN